MLHRSGAAVDRDRSRRTGAWAADPEAMHIYLRKARRTTVQCLKIGESVDVAANGRKRRADWAAAQ